MRGHRNSALVEWQDWADPVLKEPFSVKDGRIEIPNCPGAGIEWDETAVERYLYKV